MYTNYSDSPIPRDLKRSSIYKIESNFSSQKIYGLVPLQIGYLVAIN